MASKRFNFRTFTSFILAWCFLTLIISGAILYVAPPGRIANWTRWQLVVLTKEQWQAVHTLTAIVFLVGGLFHLLKFNWRAFLAYMKRKTESRLQFRNEMLASAALFLLILAGTIAQRAPFATVMAAGESIRQSWESPSLQPPIPHMEEMTLAELAKNMQMEPGQLMQSLQTLGYKAAGPEESLQELAKRYGRSPGQIYAALKSGNAASAGEHQPVAGGGGGGGGRGIGFKTLAQYAGEIGLTPQAAVESLAAKGIAAKADERMRDIAERSGRKPYELTEILNAASRK